MKSELQEQWKFFCDKMTELGLTEIQTKSLFMKLYLLHKYEYLITEHLDGKSRSIIDMLHSNNVTYANLLSKCEITNVSESSIKPETHLNLTDVFNKISDQGLFSLLYGYDVKKIKGQYFTDEEIVNSIYKTVLKENDKLQEDVTIVDFSSGLGDFQSPILVSDYTFYSVELDTLSFEFSLFNVLWNPEIPKSQKVKALLTAKFGDSLLAYQKKPLDKLVNSKSGKKLLIRYLQERLELLSSQNSPSESEILSALELRESITENFPASRDFNWYIDFPEIFFEVDGSFKLDPGFDIVVGNPPWVSYGAIDLLKYEKLFSQQSFSSNLYGKFNFSLPFVILAFQLSRSAGGLVVPQGILTETYAHKWRDKVFSDNFVSKIELLQQHWFSDVINEFCLIFWDKNKKSDSIMLKDWKEETKIEISNTSVQSPTYRIPLISKEIYSEIEKVVSSSSKVSDICNIRRGLTLTKEYQENYQRKRKSNFNQIHIKKLVRHNRVDLNYPEGIFNFQVFHSGEEFVYDRKRLGAPGNTLLFEQPKIIRRNRGKLWLIGLDLEGEYYVNDIFDLIYSKDSNISIETIFGYLTSSLVQYLAENYLQRDITSNFVRNLPFPKLPNSDFKEIKKLVDDWYISEKTKESIRTMRNKVDEIIFKHYNFSKKTKDTILEKARFHWK